MNLTLTVNGPGQCLDEKGNIMKFEQVLVSLDGLPELVLKQVVPSGKGTATWASYRLTFGPRGGPKVQQFYGEPKEGI